MGDCGSCPGTAVHTTGLVTTSYREYVHEPSIEALYSRPVPHTVWERRQLLQGWWLRCVHTHKLNGILSLPLRDIQDLFQMLPAGPRVPAGTAPGRCPPRGHPCPWDRMAFLEDPAEQREVKDDKFTLKAHHLEGLRRTGATRRFSARAKNVPARDRLHGTESHRGPNRHIRP